jgi:hypothetical protein
MAGSDSATPRRFFCPDEQALPCEQRGYNSEVYVLDPMTGRTLKFGPFEREEVPRVTSRSQAGAVTITAQSCREEASF